MSVRSSCPTGRGIIHTYIYSLPGSGKCRIEEIANVQSAQDRGPRTARSVLLCPRRALSQTPVFMNVGTQGAIKGGVSALDLKEVGCQIELSNTYHLHLRPGDGSSGRWAAS